MLLRICCVVLLGALLSACVSVSDRTQVSVGYYDVGGTSFDELDKQIALHGPKVDGVGNAVASTAVRMIPDIYFRMLNGQCRVISARVRVRANVTLPKLRDINKAKQELQGAFSNIERYARIHEAVHVAIADSHAEMAEDAIMNLAPTRDCEILRGRILKILEDIMTDHEKAQRLFDAEEQQRFKESSVG
jgi:predicted secreted Zn-dependent protease